MEAELAQRDGRFDESLEILLDVRRLHEVLGVQLGITITMQRRAETLGDANRLDEAAAAFREVLEHLDELGMTSFRSTTMVTYGNILYRLGETEEAERLATEGEQLGAAEDYVNFAWGRALRARIAADRSNLGEAMTLAQESMENAYRTDFPMVHANSHEALAHVLAASGRSDDAQVEQQRALELWSQYGFRAQAERARALLIEL